MQRARRDPPEYADIHNHLLPGVDDGVDSMDEAIRHLRAMTGAGVTRLAVSSHLHGWIVHEGRLASRLDEIEAAFRSVKRACENRDDVPELVLGQEILLHDAEIARRVFQNRRVGFEGTDYALIEFGFHIEGDPLEVIRATQTAGRRAIIAHPERYNRDGGLVTIAEIRRWKEVGALLQINGDSILNGYGEGIRDLAWRIIDEGLADLIASDHHGDDRMVSPARVAEKMVERGSAKLVRPLLADNPHRILRNDSTRRITESAREAAA